MKDAYIDYLINKGLNVQNTRRMPYSTITTPEGKKLYVSEKRPINKAMSLDFYQLATLAAYLAAGKEQQIGTFNMLFRRNFCQGAYTVFLGLNDILEFLEQLEYTGEDIDFMKAKYDLPNNVWEYLRELKFTGKVEAFEEGSMVQPYLPLIQITDALPIAHIIETQLLTLSGYKTSVATRAARITSQAKGLPWLEFGLRGAPGIEGGLIASEAAYIGGAAGTSNVLADQLKGVPASGTMPHAYVQSFGGREHQVASFVNWMQVFGEDSGILIDTYSYESGTRDAYKASEIVGIDRYKERDDSSDLVKHSINMRKFLDRNDRNGVKLFVSNEIDEYKLQQLISQGACIDGVGCGRRVVTVPDLGMVYKLVQVIKQDNTVMDTIKISGDSVKTTDPGLKQVDRYYDKDGKYFNDVMCLVNSGTSTDVINRESSRYVADYSSMTKETCLKTFMYNGKLISTYKTPTTDELKQRVFQNMKKLPSDMHTLEKVNPIERSIGLSKKLYDLKKRLIEKNSKNYMAL